MSKLSRYVQWVDFDVAKQFVVTGLILFYMTGLVFGTMFFAGPQLLGHEAQQYHVSISEASSEDIPGQAILNEYSPTQQSVLVNALDSEVTVPATDKKKIQAVKQFSQYEYVQLNGKHTS